MDEITLAERPLDYAIALLRSANPRTQRAYRGALRSVLAVLTEQEVLAIPQKAPEFVDWHTLTPAQARIVRARLQEQYSPASTNLALAAIRAMLSAAYDERTMSTDDYMRLTRKGGPLASVKFHRLPSGRYITPKEKGNLSRALTHRSKKISAAQASSARNAAMLALGFSLGPRVSEMANLDFEDYDPDSGLVHIRSGKGNKDRRDRLHAPARKAMDAWLEIRGNERGPVFLPINKAGEISHRRMSPQAIEYLCERLARWANIDPFTWHDIRRTAGSDLIEGSDLSIAGEILGHADPRTTSGYDRRPEERRAQAISTVSIPFGN